MNPCAPVAAALGLSELITGDGKEVTPVPDKATDRGLPGALSEIVRLPVRLPAEEGVNVTLIAQPEPGWST